MTIAKIIDKVKCLLGFHDWNYDLKGSFGTSKRTCKICLKSEYHDGEWYK